MSFLSRSLSAFPVQLALLLCALWHSMFWYFERMSDHTDEHRALIALITLAGLFIIGRKSKDSFGEGTKSPFAILILLGGYFASLLWAPNLIQFWFAISAVAFLLWNNCDPSRRNLVGFTGLAILASPLFASMEFYIGYPLRNFAAIASSWLLNMAGMEVTVYGTMFSIQNQMIAVDAPCSGIKCSGRVFISAFCLVA
jgi:Transmembrane exosortase (Exosortase_EpsH).